MNEKEAYTMKFKPFILLSITYLTAIMPRIFERPDYSPLMGYHYAHRGLFDNDKKLPENSIPAFKKAIESGYGIELDVQLTKDRIPVVFHDDTLKRVCGVNDSAKDYTYAELTQFHLFDTDEIIPTLEEVLMLIDGQVPLIIELKFPENPLAVCKFTDRVLSGYQGTYCIESFHPLILRWYKVNHPEIIRGQLSSNFNTKKKNESVAEGLVHHLLINFLSRPDFIAYNHEYKHNASRLFCRYLYHSLSVSWTIHSQKELNACRKDFDLFIFEGFVPE